MSLLRVPSPSGWNGAADAANGPVEGKRPKLACPGWAFGSTARGNSNTFVGIPLGRLLPATVA